MAVVVTTLFSAYLLLDPAPWLVDLVELSYLSLPFKLFLLILAVAGFLVAFVGEHYIFVWLSQYIGKVHDRMWPRRKKKRKEYKVWQEKMWV